VPQSRARVPGDASEVFDNLLAVRRTGTGLDVIGKRGGKPECRAIRGPSAGPSVLVAPWQSVNRAPLSRRASESLPLEKGPFPPAALHQYALDPCANRLLRGSDRFRHRVSMHHLLPGGVCRRLNVRGGSLDLRSALSSAAR